MELRYSRAKFHYTVLIAILLTAMITGLCWMILTGIRFEYAFSTTVIVSTVFFVFCSLGMLWRYYHNEIVFAVRNSGLLDTRWSPEIIGWDDIREVILLRRESEFALEVRLWPKNQGMEGQAQIVDLTAFDATIQEVVAEIEKHVPVRHELR